MFHLVQLNEGVTDDESPSTSKQSIRQKLVCRSFIWECDPREERGGVRNDGSKINTECMMGLVTEGLGGGMGDAAQLCKSFPGALGNVSQTHSWRRTRRRVCVH